MTNFETGRAPVGTTPPGHPTGVNPFLGAALKAEGVDSPPPPPPGAGRAWQDAGPPPGTKSGIPTWAIILISVGGALILACCGITGVAAVIGDDDPEQTSPTVAAEDETEPETEAPAMPPVSQPEVEVTGECKKKIIGNYGLLASITVDNPTDQEVTGTAWVRWRVLGDDPEVFSQEMTVVPDSATEFHVDEEIDSERWFRVEECDYGWTPAEDGTD